MEAKQKEQQQQKQQHNDLCEERFNFSPMGPVVTVSCVTPLEHLQLTRSTNNSFANYCRTGVRVYAGAEVMSHFILQNKTFFQQSYSKENGDSSGAILEVGCGCGLSGIMAAHYVNMHQNVFLTDYDDKALELVRQSIARQQPEIRQRIRTQSLDWSNDESINALLQTLNQQHTTNKNSRFDVIIGTELVYYRVSIFDLFAAAMKLLSSDGVMLMAHHVRLVDAAQQMEDSAKQLDLHVDYVRLESFLSEDLIVRRGWGGIQFLMVTRKQHRDRIVSKHFSHLQLSPTPVYFNDNSTEEGDENPLANLQALD